MGGGDGGGSSELEQRCSIMYIYRQQEKANLTKTTASFLNPPPQNTM